MSDFAIWDVTTFFAGFDEKYLANPVNKSSEGGLSFFFVQKQSFESFSGVISVQLTFFIGIIDFDANGTCVQVKTIDDPR